MIVPILSFMWHFENTHLPISDGVDYLKSAYSIYLYYENNDALNFVISIFNERGWRPIIFQLFLVPFLIITSGNLLASVLLTHLFFNTLTTLFIFKIISSFANKFSSSIATLILCLSFNVFFGGEPMPLFSEISFIAFLTATIYFLLDSDLFLKKKNCIWFSVFFTLTIMTRPIEGFLFLSIPFIFLIFKRYKAYVTYNEILKGTTYLIFFLWVLFISRVFPEISSSVVKIGPPYSEEIFLYLAFFVSLLLSVQLLLLYKSKKNYFDICVNKNTYFSKCMFFSGLSLWLWYTPRFGSLYGWIYATSIGDHFAYMKHNNHSALDLLYNSIKNNGDVIIYLCLLILLIVYTVNKIKSHKYIPKTKNYNEKFVNLNIIILTAVPIPIILYLFTFQTSYRKISPVITILLLLIFIHIFRSNTLIRFNTIIFTTFLILQTYSLTTHIFQHDNNETYVNKSEDFTRKIIGVSFPQPINSREKSYDNLIDSISSHYSKGYYKELTLLLDDSAYPVERYMLKFLCEKNSLNCKFLHAENYKENILSFNNDNEAYLTIFKKNNYPIVSKENKIDLNKKLSLYRETRSPAELYSLYLSYLIAGNNLDSHGLYLKECKNFYKDYFSCLVLKK